MAEDFDYLPDAELAANIDPKLLNQLADRTGKGVGDPTVITSAKKKATMHVLGFVVLQHPHLPDDVLNSEQEVPEQLKQWILDIFLYKLYKQNKRSAIPEAVSVDFAATEAQLATFARTGIPQLVAEPEIDAPGQPISGNMTEADLGNATQDGEPLMWSEML